MSIQTLSWAFSQHIPNVGAKMVLLALADHADDRGLAWPKLATMEGRTSLGRRTIQRHIAHLAELGLVEKRDRHFVSGRQTSNIYRLRLDVMLPAPERGEDRPEDLDDDGFPVGDGDGAYEGDDIGLGAAAETTAQAAPSRAEGCQIGTPEGGRTVTVEGDTATAPMILQKDPSEENPRERRAREAGKVAATAPRPVKAPPDDDEAGFDRFFAAWRAAEPKHCVDPRTPAFAAWRRMSPDERRAAAETAAIEAVVLEQRRAGRQRLLSATTYLRDRMWTRLPAPAAAGPARVETLGGWSRHWWVRWWITAHGGGRGPMKASLMVDHARRGISCTVLIDEADAIRLQAAGFVGVPVASPEFVAWREHLRLQGITLPTPDRAEFAFLPSPTPPELI